MGGKKSRGPGFCNQQGNRMGAFDNVKYEPQIISYRNIVFKISGTAIPGIKLFPLYHINPGGGGA